MNETPDPPRMTRPQPPVGIDLGTSFSVVAAFRDGEPRVLGDVPGEILYQGEHSTCAENTLLGNVSVTDLPPALAGEQTVDVRFTYDLNGILEVECTVQSTMRKQRLVVDRSSGLSEAQRADALARLQSGSPTLERGIDRWRRQARSSVRAPSSLTPPLAPRG